MDAYQSGVSNGDVDWLFRGRSKRKERKEDENDDRSHRPVKNGTSEKESAQRKGKEPERGQERVENRVENKIGETRVQNKQGSTASSTSGNDPPNQEDTKPKGKLERFRFGRSRSASNPVEGHVAQVTQRRLSESISRSNSGKRALFTSFFRSDNRSDGANPDGRAETIVEARPEMIPAKEDGVSSLAALSGPIEGIELEKRPVSQGVAMRRVNFALHLLEKDPQQQIPSRRPRKGNLLVPDDLVAPVPRLSQGIALPDGGKAPEHHVSDKELQAAIEAQKRALQAAERCAAEAHMQAKRIASDVKRIIADKKKKKEKEEEEEYEVSIDHNVDKLEIDNEMHLSVGWKEEEESIDTCDSSLPSLETIYTRCCHLREILPIPATLKQLKNKSRPLQVLKLLNPKPTLIDVLSFSDFVAITPINTVILDNVSITTEMLRHFMCALVGNKQLEKLSLRNVAIDETGWRYLCVLLRQNTSLRKLDISQQRIKADTKPSCIRSALPWDVLIDSITARGGIEELVINGCKVSGATFEKLIGAVRLSTLRLGIAAIDLDAHKARIVADWLSESTCKCLGVDIGFNDVSQGQTAAFCEAFRRGAPSLIFFSLNSTRIPVEDARKLLDALATLPRLRFLDMSGLSGLFPAIIPKLCEVLPKFPSLKRIHFDSNDLSGAEIAALAEVIPKVQGLLHVSMLGNIMTESSSGALYAAIKASPSVFALDIDYERVPEEISQRIAFYLMRNMGGVMKNETQYSENIKQKRKEKEKNNSEIDEKENRHDIVNPDDNPISSLMFDGSLLMKTAEKLLLECTDEAKIQQYIADALVTRAHTVRADIHRTIDSLFAQRTAGTLSLDGKETLLRFCLLDSSLEKLLRMLEHQVTPDNALHRSSTELIMAGPILSPRTEMRNVLECVDTNPHPVVAEKGGIPIDNSTGRPVLMRSVSSTSMHAKKLEVEEGELHRFGFFMQNREAALKEVPSGPELRDAVMTAKGIESVTELIDKITDKRVSWGSLYGDGDDNVVDEAYDKLLNDEERKRTSDNRQSNNRQSNNR